MARAAVGARINAIRKDDGKVPRVVSARGQRRRHSLQPAKEAASARGQTGKMRKAIWGWKRELVRAHYFLGLARLFMNDWRPTVEATRQFQDELKYHPRDFAANYKLGYFASEEHKYGAAQKYLQIAVQQNPAWPESWLYMGLNAYAQGDMKHAEEMLCKRLSQPAAMIRVPTTKYAAPISIWGES